MSLRDKIKILISITPCIISRDVHDSTVQKKNILKILMSYIWLVKFAFARKGLSDYLPVGHMEAIIWSNPV